MYEVNVVKNYQDQVRKIFYQVVFRLIIMEI